MPEVSNAYDGSDGTPGRPPRLRQELAPPRQVHLQFVDDTWERLLNALERLEQVTEGFRSLTAIRLDRHTDRDQVVEDEIGVRGEVHLQIECLRQVIHPVRDEGRWMVGDFLSWYGGRDDRSLAAVDEYAVPILRCLLGQPYDLPPLDEIEVTEGDVLDAAEAIGAGVHESDRIEERFAGDPTGRVTRHTHVRGTAGAGLRRVARLDPMLAAQCAPRPPGDAGPAAAETRPN